jgi:glutathione S-transferase
MAQYKLYYFNLRGRAEVIRYVLVAAGQDYEDVRFGGEEWRAKYKAQTPSGQCPFLEVHESSNKIVLFQSIPIGNSKCSFNMN